MSTILFTAWGYGVSILEFTAALTSFVGVSLGVTGKRITWPWWALSGSLYAIFFYQADLFASAALQIVFIGAAIWGWFGWGPKGAVPSALTTKQRTISAASLLIAFVLLTPVLQSLGAAATWSDAIIFLGSAFAQVIMVYEKYEAWPLWFAINVLATVQYAVLGYWFTSVLYAVFTIVALLGWKRWYESHRSAH